MLLITAEDIIREGPCVDYPEEKVRSLWGNSPRCLAQIEEIEAVPYSDRIWLLAKLAPDVVSSKTVKLWALDYINVPIEKVWVDGKIKFSQWVLDGRPAPYYLYHTTSWYTQYLDISGFYRSRPSDRFFKIYIDELKTYIEDPEHYKPELELC